MTKKEYRDAYKQEEKIQYLEDNASFDFSKECKNKKALFLVDIMAKQHVGYKLEYKNLACKRWSKWVKDNPSFTSCFNPLNQVYRLNGGIKMQCITGKSKF